LPETRSAIREVLKKSEPEPPDTPESKVRHLRGILRGLQLDQDWIEVNIDGENTKIYGAKEEIDDVVGSMVVNHRVVVEVVERSDRSVKERYSSRDLQLEFTTGRRCDVASAINSFYAMSML
jgi:hypothetical protein